MYVRCLEAQWSGLSRVISLRYDQTMRLAPQPSNRFALCPAAKGASDTPTTVQSCSQMSYTNFTCFSSCVPRWKGVERGAKEHGRGGVSGITRAASLPFQVWRGKELWLQIASQLLTACSSYQKDMGYAVCYLSLRAIA